MKFYFLLPLMTINILSAQTYDKVFPESINTSESINVTADCKYAPSTAPSNIPSREDCLVGTFELGGWQNFSYEGDGTLSIQATLPSSATNKDIILTVYKLNVNNNGKLLLNGFHGVTSGSINLNNASLEMNLVDEKKNSASQSAYGTAPVFVLMDDLLNQESSHIIKSQLLVKNGDIVLGKISLLIDEFSHISATKDNSMNPTGTHKTPTIKSQAHIINYGYIMADTLKNGESITIGNNGFPGVGNQNISGTIDNYGLIAVTHVDNAANGTINFRSFNSKMGNISGTLTNNNGKLNIYVAGAGYRTHVLASAGSTGFDQANIIFDNNASEFITANIDSTSDIKLVIRKKEESVSAFQRTFDGSQRGILNVLDSRHNIYTYGGSDFLKKVVNDTHKGIYSGYLSAPLTMLESMKPKFNTFNTKLDINLIGNGFFGSDLGLGGLGGFNVNYRMAIGRYITHYQLGYGYGAINNERKNYNTDIKGHVVSFGAMNQFKLFDRLETETMVYSLIGLFDSHQTFKMAELNATPPSSKSGFNIFSLGADTRLGYQINFGNLSMKPFMGFNQIISIRNKLVEKGGFNVVIPSTNSYTMYLSTGLENRYSFSNKKHIYAKLGYEYKMLNTRNLTIILSKPSNLL